MGYTGTVDERGRVVIPKEIREKLNLREGSKVEITLDNGRIIINLRKVSIDSIYGVAGKENVKIEDIEEALSLKIMIDSNVFIYVLFFPDPLYGERAKELLEIVETEEAYSSTLIISQVLAHLERRGKNHVIPVFINYLQQSGMNIAETNWEDIINALRILQSSGLSYKLWDDATIFAQMKRLKIDTIYSNDKDFDLFNIKRKF